MKTQIITLESHDDLISVRDRLSWAKTPRILLVAPKYVKVNLRQVDLKVLQRHASALGAQLGLVTRQRRVRAASEEVGIPVFTSTGEAQKVAWMKTPQTRLQRKAPDKTLREKREQIQIKEAAWRAHPAARIPIFLVGVLSVFAIAALFIPRAQVTLNPIKQTQSIVIPVNANPSVKDVFITGSIPAREKQIIVEGEQKIRVTGEGIAALSKAKGFVIFRNLTQGAVTIPIGTVVTSDDVRFVTIELGLVNPGVGETVELEVEAVEGGLSGNLEAETINAVDGRLGLSLSVLNPELMEGGRERASVQATDADRARAKELLLKSLEEDARASLLDEFNSDDVFFDETISLSQIISENYDLPVGAAGSQLTLTMQVEYSILYVSASDLTELASLALNASLPSGFIPASAAVTFESATSPVALADQSIHWTIRTEREIVQQVNTVQVTQLVQALDVSAAQTQLEKNLPLLSKPKVTLSPSWWPWVPMVPFRIEVVTQ
ncbi:MAG TPA: baseplate J/gp47 family protein [Anaerolineales bacterium]|nr:baseplate J/gp47 family protein [Anaerolineales bacterium]